ncbi:hypothetical protein D5125_03835 [Magnetovirga frankeli]|uniref:hypothetical protein n=1 Tax=Magnetovirga frankeli TaxID=947516 RepID=UPI0012940D66|nr:hypothetical protein D5125_03835 [gamma proteobacterium SS-5]
MTAFGSWLDGYRPDRCGRTVLLGSGLEIGPLVARNPELCRIFSGACYTDPFHVVGLAALAPENLAATDTLISLGADGPNLPVDMLQASQTGLYGRWASLETQTLEQEAQGHRERMIADLDVALKGVRRGILLVEAQLLEPLVGEALDHVHERLDETEVWCIDQPISNALFERGMRVKHLEMRLADRKEDVAHRYRECMAYCAKNSVMARMLGPEDGWPLFNGLYYDRLVFYALGHFGVDSWAAERVARESWSEVVIHVGPLRSQHHVALLRHFRARGVRLVLVPTHLTANLFGPRLVRALRPSGVVEVANLAGPLGAAYARSLSESPVKKATVPVSLLVVFDLKWRWEARKLVAERVSQGERVWVKCRSDRDSYNGITTERAFCDRYLKLESRLKGGGYTLLGDDLTLAEAVFSSDEVYAAKGSAAAGLASHLGRRGALFDRGGSLKPISDRSQ